MSSKFTLKLRELADKKNQKAQEGLAAPRLDNTHRRQRFADAARAKFNSMQASASLYIAVANAIDEGRNGWLSKLSNLGLIDSLFYYARSTKNDRYQESRVRMPGVYLGSLGNDLKKEISISGFEAVFAELCDTSSNPTSDNYIEAKRFVEYLAGRVSKSSSIKVQEIFLGLKKELKLCEAYIDAGIVNNALFLEAIREVANVPDNVTLEPKWKKLERQLAYTKGVGIDFFDTSVPEAELMAELAEIKPGELMLEPNGGSGKLADAARKAGAVVEVVEISSTLVEILEGKGHSVIGRDFETFEPEKKYNVIMMNPPFSDRKDAKHIMKAYTHLEEGGRLVAIAGEGVFIGQDKQAVEFRAWLESVGATVEKMPERSFMHPTVVSQTGVNARRIYIAA